MSVPVAAQAIIFSFGRVASSSPRSCTLLVMTIVASLTRGANSSGSVSGYSS